MQDRVLNLLNVLLILISGACIYYLATQRYTEPSEIRQARRLLEMNQQTPDEADAGRTDTTFEPSPRPDPNPLDNAYFPNLERDAMRPLYTPTPSPTPTPTPTPKPAVLQEAVFHWQILELQPNEVTFRDERSGEQIALKVGESYKGEGAIDKSANRPEVTLSRVDLSEFAAYLTHEDQTVKKVY